MTGQGWVEAGRSVPEVGEEGVGQGGRDAKSSGSKVGEGGGAENEGDLAGLAVEAVWAACRVVSTLVATLESKVETFFLFILLPLLHPTRQLTALTCRGQCKIGMGFSGIRRPAADRLQACMSFPLGCLKHPKDSCFYLWGGRYVQAFPLAVLPSGTTQVPVLAKNVTVQGW